MELSRTPVITLEKYINKKIHVSLKNNFQLEGTLESFDKFNNMLLKNAVQIKENDTVQLDEVYINGHNLISILETEN